MTESLSVAVVAKSRGNAAKLVEALRRNDASGHVVGTDEELQRLIRGSRTPDGAFVDVAGFGREIWEICEQLRGKGVPFFLVSGADFDAVHKFGLQHGARATVRKPMSMKLFSEMLKVFAEESNGDGSADPESTV